MPGCCASDTDCEDDSICTSDSCTDSGECENEPIEDCCESKEDCNDDNECTFDACQNNLCVHVPTPNAEGCCATDEDCLVENDACILSSWCMPATATCEHDAVECDDGDPCTLDECVDGECIATTDNSPEECCLSDADCDDQKLCTVDTCTPQVGCNHSDIPFCCEVDDDCNDDTAQTTDTCVANVCQYCEDFTFEIEQVPVDIVFVVDQSTSMTDKIDLVRTYLNDFAAYITTAGVDYHVLLVATRYQGENAICIDPPLAGENCKDSDTFRQINKQVGSHNGLQLVMENINDIEAFMRPNSQRQFVLISDDESDVGALTFDFFLIAQGDYDGYTFHSIIGQAIPSCATGVGNIYAQLSNGTGGLLVDICSADWTQSFQQLGDSTATASQSFPLTHPADVASLDVVIGGLPATAGFDYTYDAQSHRIILTDPLPPPDTAINVCYKPFGAP